MSGSKADGCGAGPPVFVGRFLMPAPSPGGDGCEGPTTKLFEVQGQTLLQWKMTVAADSAWEAAESAREGAGACGIAEAGPASVTRMAHRIIRCDPAPQGAHAPGGGE